MCEHGLWMMCQKSLRVSLKRQPRLGVSWCNNINAIAHNWENRTWKTHKKTKGRRNNTETWRAAKGNEATMGRISEEIAMYIRDGEGPLSFAIANKFLVLVGLGFVFIGRMLEVLIITLAVVVEMRLWLLLVRLSLHDRSGVYGAVALDGVESGEQGSG